MISGKQIRAARVLLDWDAEDLAEKASLNRETIFNIERGTVQARPSTLEKIEQTFNEHRVEFLDNQGVRFRPEGVDVLNGPKGLATFFDQIYDYLKNHGGLVCVSGVDEAQFAAHHGAEHASGHIKRMRKLVEDRHDIQFRVLLREGDTNFMASHYCEYKWQAKESFVPTPFYVYGDNLALISFIASPAPKIMIIQSEVFAEAYRKQFKTVWDIAKKAMAKEDK